MNVNPFSYLIEKLKSKVDTAGIGLVKSGTTISTFVPRVAQSANTKPGQNSFDINEYNASSADLPDSNFYHILTAEGPDDAYLTQIALGMTANKMYYRRCNANVWGPWEELAFKSDIPTVKKAVNASEVLSDAKMLIFLVGKGMNGYNPVSLTLTIPVATLDATATYYEISDSYYNNDVLHLQTRMSTTEILLADTGMYLGASKIPYEALEWYYI